MTTTATLIKELKANGINVVLDKTMPATSKARCIANTQRCYIAINPKIKKSDVYKALLHEALHAIQWLYARQQSSVNIFEPIGFNPRTQYAEDKYYAYYVNRGEDIWALELEAIATELYTHVAQAVIYYLQGQKNVFKAVAIIEKQFKMKEAKARMGTYFNNYIA